MSPDDRRRQLIGIGLQKLVEQPIQDLSLDEVAAEAGVSRGLLFHYFPTKTGFHRAVVEAATRRVLRNVRPDAGVTGEAAVAQIAERFIAQIVRRRTSYLALVYGQRGTPSGTMDGTPRSPEDVAANGTDTAANLRGGIAALLLAANAPTDDTPADVTPTDSGLPHTTGRPTAMPLSAARGWVAYVEELALQAPAPSPALTSHCVEAYRALAAVAPLLFT